MNVVEALERPQEAGKKNGRAAKTLRDEADGGFSPVYHGHYLVKYFDEEGDPDGQIWVNGTGESFYTHPMYTSPQDRRYIPALTTDGALEFANDVEGGLLDDIASWLDDRTIKTAQMTHVLQKAAAKKDMR
jgi:hypothetical protein